MAEFSTPPKMRRLNKAKLNTPIEIPASPLLEKIGYGTGVAVYMFERSSKVGRELSPWAVKKRLKGKSNKRNDKNLKLEADVLRQLNHPNIIGFRAFTKGADGKSCLAMEALDMSLGDKIEKRRETFKNKPFRAKTILKVAFEIAKGLEYLHHTAYILHGDIKSWNILVSNDFNTVKLCDFGNSLPLTKSFKIDTSKGNFSYVGTTCWNPPEIISENGPVTNAADIWTYGLVLWEMIALSTPHCEDFNENESFDSCTTSEDTRNNQLDKSDVSINENKYGTRPALPAIDFSKDYKNILEIFFACTTVDHKLRPCAKILVNHYKKYPELKKK
ncbi:PREDICTED: lymphokine-activated killer T-cell-originated protein kinase [Trachymyrmex cornetzi]|uniref:Lymphokine-activated killer T-cell-originated protein kinase n=1 Tax=Trachymyrmex cornetzi TaxID=471704 RepID=A0A151J1M1_9HYME|nr:PREDICTED: lymphokine-activated killer T-cell-originated protein kinase [Trachymyrmex cornetzi]XP_018368577.1 PREDICTED: lymphokine-activated killer T-cell-originated protein kinase [Trachymyrmex cornetzi]KYN15741.1 Lymphokine-activated killer T-cell-originated protein kinase [Trachymyrmex cornetzi]